VTTVADIHTALVARLATISGLNASLAYWPTSISPPTIFTPAPSAEYIVQGGLLYVDVLHFESTLCLPWQQNEEAERQLMELYGAVPTVLQAQPGLGLGAMAQIEDRERPEFLKISGTLYRTLVYPIRVKYGGVIS
jgi:hypothetical protein